jgi:hypothetical protein
MTFVHAKLSQTGLFKPTKAFARLRDGLLKEHQNIVFTRSFDGENVITFEDTVNVLVNCFTEEGVTLLFSKPGLIAEQLERANEFAYVACTDQESRGFDLQTTLAIHYIQQMFPIQNNRRQARQREIERFLSRELRLVWTDAYVNWLTELLFVQDYADARYITFFRFTA